MAFETKVILTSLLRNVAQAKTLKQAYNAIAEAASVEGVQAPSYEDYIKKLEDEQKE